MKELILDLRHEFSRHRRLAERAMMQLDDDAFFRRPQNQVNSLALIVKHLSGNLRARWTNFLTNDGETGRDRDAEFVVGPDDTRTHLMAQWDAGWGALEETIESLSQTNSQQIITIRGEPHTVQQALLRGLSHAAYHTGQILYLVRLWKPDAPWLTIAPGKSQSHKASYRNA